MIGITWIAWDYGGTIDAHDAPTDPATGCRPVSDAAAASLRRLHTAGYHQILASNTIPTENRLLALTDAGIADVFDALLTSTELGVANLRTNRPGHGALCAHTGALAGWESR